MQVSGANLFILPQSQPNQHAAVPTVLDNALDTELTEEEEKVVRELKQTDQEVRAHEQAHKSAGGAYAGSIQYETTTGPDGREYAVAGEVPIDASPVPNNPEATLRKMDIVIRAALAPAQPSPQDMAVARAAQQARAEAQKELFEQREAERNRESYSPAARLKALLAGLENVSNLTETQRGRFFNSVA